MTPLPEFQLSENGVMTYLRNASEEDKHASLDFLNDSRGLYTLFLKHSKLLTQLEIEIHRYFEIEEGTDYIEGLLQKASSLLPEHTYKLAETDFAQILSSYKAEGIDPTEFVTVDNFIEDDQTYQTISVFDLDKQIQMKLQRSSEDDPNPPDVDIYIQKLDSNDVVQLRLGIAHKYRAGRGYIRSNIDINDLSKEAEQALIREPINDLQQIDNST